LANAKTAFQNGQQQINQALAQPLGAGGPLISTSVTTSGTTTLTTPQEVAGPLGVTIVTPTPQVQPVTVQPVPNIAQMILNPSQNTILQNQQSVSVAGSYATGGSPGTINIGTPTKVGQG
jgi:tRNA A37 threonylcarbamoyladenosine synthetase subunit TsaC/SUA5/YrdC